MKIILGQGNPGADYATSRHNLGFMVLDAFAQAHDLNFQAKPKFKADLAEFNHNGDKILLVKPTTFYNDTGQTARALLDFYKLDPTNLLIVHDELALPFGVIRTRLGGSDAGNNGVKSINRAIGPATARLRLGIWNDQRERIDDASFVLSRLSQAEAQQWPSIRQRACDLIDHFLDDRFTASTHHD